MENKEYLDKKKMIAEEIVKMLRPKEGMYTEGQVKVACMSAIDRWEKY